MRGRSEVDLLEPKIMGTLEPAVEGCTGMTLPSTYGALMSLLVLFSCWTVFDLRQEI